MTWALGCLGPGPRGCSPGLLGSLVAAARPLLPQLNTHDLAQLAWGVAALGVASHASCAALVDTLVAVTQPLLDSFAPQVRRVGGQVCVWGGGAVFRVLVLPSDLQLPTLWLLRRCPHRSWLVVGGWWLTVGGGWTRPPTNCHQPPHVPGLHQLPSTTPCAWFTQTAINHPMCLVYTNCRQIRQAAAAKHPRQLPPNTPGSCRQTPQAAATKHPRQLPPNTPGSCRQTSQAAATKHPRQLPPNPPGSCHQTPQAAATKHPRQLLTLAYTWPPSRHDGPGGPTLKP